MALAGLTLTCSRQTRPLGCGGASVPTRDQRSSPLVTHGSGRAFEPQDQPPVDRTEQRGGAAGPPSVSSSAWCWRSRRPTMCRSSSPLVPHAAGERKERRGRPSLVVRGHTAVTHRSRPRDRDFSSRFEGGRSAARRARRLAPGGRHSASRTHATDSSSRSYRSG